MIAVFASVKGEDGKVRAERFLLADEEANELRGTDTDRLRPWSWSVAAASHMSAALATTVLKRSMPR